MSRIGKRPIPVPAGVTVAIDGSAVTVKGPKENSPACCPPTSWCRRKGPSSS